MKQKTTLPWMTEVLVAWEREQEKLTSDEIESKMKRHKKTPPINGYWADQKWRVWTELLRDKKLQSLLED